MKRLLATVAIVVLLAGCVEPDQPAIGGGGSKSTSTSHAPGSNGFAAQQGTAHGSNQAIDVDVVWRACDAGFCANATARNAGTATVRISSICEPAWLDRMKHDGNQVQPHEPQAMCAAYGRAAFGPGATSHWNFTWDESLWDESAQAFYRAPEGSYTWSLVFWWDDGQGGDRQEAIADVHFIVGET